MVDKAVVLGQLPAVDALASDSVRSAPIEESWLYHPSRGTTPSVQAFMLTCRCKKPAAHVLSKQALLRGQSDTGFMAQALESTMCPTAIIAAIFVRLDIRTRPFVSVSKRPPPRTFGECVNLVFVQIA